LQRPWLGSLGNNTGYRNSKPNKEEHRYGHDLYERRLAIYKAVIIFLSRAIREGELTLEMIARFYDETAECDFLFGPEIRKWIDELYSTGLELRKPGGDPEKALAALYSFSGEINSARTRFSKYMNLSI
jgi:hypothetical protein